MAQHRSHSMEFNANRIETRLGIMAGVYKINLMG
jgi:hypothetical protein